MAKMVTAAVAVCRRATAAAGGWQVCDGEFGVGQLVEPGWPGKRRVTGGPAAVAAIGLADGRRALPAQRRS